MPAEVDSTLTFACYVEQKFVPDHVEHKTRAGRTHYQAMLKHMLRPETVNCIFGNISKTRRTLKAIPDWPYLDGVRLCDVTTDQVRKTIFAASSHGYSAQTLKHIKNVIEAVISHAQEEGCFHGTNPALVVKLPPLKHNPRRALSARQVSQALELMQYPERQIALITVYTGLKLTEICELRWNDLNLSLSPRMLDGEKLSPLTLKVRRKRKRSDEDGGPGGSMTVDIPGPASNFTGFEVAAG